MSGTDDFFMSLAIDEAKKAFQKAEVPVGALLVKGDVILSRTHNLREKAQNPLGHAELLAIEETAKKLNSWRLSSCSLYVSLEPCLMCFGAILQSRISRIIYACPDPKTGFSSKYGLDHKTSSLGKIKISRGIGEEASQKLLQSFFKGLRRKNTAFQ